ncbi:MAG: peptidoglycan editing factor PgeF [Methylophilaceae bacterium]
MAEVLQTSIIEPNWPAPSNVHAIQTTRLGGVSLAPYDSFNLGAHVNDNPNHVAHNRQLLNGLVPTEPVWLNQVHGVHVIDAGVSSHIENADASFTTENNVVCVTMTADCLPVLLSDKTGTVVAAIHAGWRSLCDGVIEKTINAMPVDSNQLVAWLGPAIGPDAFEVGAEVRLQFIEKDEQAEYAFKPSGEQWLGNLYLLAKQRLQSLGVKDVYGETLCTYANPDRFFSFRRDGDAGRMATMIWLTD